jgi:hypothetical protein
VDGFHVLNDLILKGKLTMNRSFFQIAQVVLLCWCSPARSTRCSAP